jgi:transcriptional regulator with XRE-family HTH domain
MEMSEVMRRRRTELGMSQAELGAAAGVDPRQIRRYESGQSQPVLSVAVAIANALGLSVEELALNSRNEAKERPRATPASVIDAVKADPGLDDSGRELLTSVYRWLVRQRRGSNAKS